jgi:hypothetical protein
MQKQKTKATRAREQNAIYFLLLRLDTRTRFWFRRTAHWQLKETADIACTSRGGLLFLVPWPTGFGGCHRAEQMNGSRE